MKSEYLLPTYARLPVTLSRGKGVFVWDSNGKKYLDFFSGLAVDNLGHCPPAVTQALTHQLKKLLHVSNVFGIAEQGDLAKKLVELSGLHQVFFCNSGTEAVEACLKFARYHSLKTRESHCFQILVAENSFHGRTFGALSATMQKKYQAGFGPLLPGFKAVPFGDLEAMVQAVTEQTCAIMVEPIQGEGGVCIPPPGYLPGLRQLCDEKKILLILDEVQTGMGRTGKLFAHQHSNIKPDLMALSKALGSGFPVGACLVNKRVAESVQPGIHASTFGGNPLACRAALATLGVISKKGFLDKVTHNGAFFLDGLKKLEQKHSLIKASRGMGLMLACELQESLGNEVVGRCLEEGLLINAIQGKTLRFVPPLIVTKQQIKKGVAILSQVLTEMEKERG